MPKISNSCIKNKPICMNIKIYGPILFHMSEIYKKLTFYFVKYNKGKINYSAEAYNKGEDNAYIYKLN